MAKSWIGILKKRIGSCQEQAEASDPPWIERRRSTSSHEHKELLHLRGLVHEAVRLVMPRPKVASSGEEEGEREKDGEQNRKRTTKLSRFPSAIP